MMMMARLWIWVGVTLALPGLAHAAEATVQPGVYGTEGGWGTMTINASRFKIYAVGVNGHSCGLEGSLVGHQGQSDECSIEMKPHGNGVTVTPTSEGCQQSCGFRAHFDGDYLRLPPACFPAALQTADQRFLAAYKAKDYGRAHAVLSQADTACRRYTDWRVNDRRSNDLAITAYHLGRKDECRRLSAQVADDKLLAQLKDVAPTDYDNFLPHYNAALKNAALCRE